MGIVNGEISGAGCSEGEAFGISRRYSRISRLCFGRRTVSIFNLLIEGAICPRDLCHPIYGYVPPLRCNRKTESDSDVNLLVEFLNLPRSSRALCLDPALTFSQIKKVELE